MQRNCEMVIGCTYIRNQHCPIYNHKLSTNLREREKIIWTKLTGFERRWINWQATTKITSSDQCGETGEILTVVSEPQLNIGNNASVISWKIKQKLLPRVIKSWGWGCYGLAGVVKGWPRLLWFGWGC